MFGISTFSEKKGASTIGTYDLGERILKEPNWFYLNQMNSIKFYINYSIYNHK